jgi:hypothetical protein
LKLISGFVAHTFTSFCNRVLVISAARYLTSSETLSIFTGVAKIGDILDSDSIIVPLYASCRLIKKLILVVSSEFI